MNQAGFEPSQRIGRLAIFATRIFVIVVKLSLVLAFTRDSLPLNFVYAGF